HLHWRLKTPTRTPAGHALLREARELAANVVGADMTCAPIVHPVRWPGSWHRKTEPVLARVTTNPEAEIDLNEALELLHVARREMEGFADRDDKIAGQLHDDLDDVAAALDIIPNNDVPWDEWNRLGLAIWAATRGAGFHIFDKWSAKASK